MSKTTDQRLVSKPYNSDYESTSYEVHAIMLLNMLMLQLPNIYSMISFHSIDEVFGDICSSLQYVCLHDIPPISFYPLQQMN